MNKLELTVTPEPAPLRLLYIAPPEPLVAISPVNMQPKTAETAAETSGIEVVDCSGELRCCAGECAAGYGPKRGSVVDRSAPVRRAVACERAARHVHCRHGVLIARSGLGEVVHERAIADGQDAAGIEVGRLDGATSAAGKISVVDEAGIRDREGSIMILAMAKTAITAVRIRCRGDVAREIGIRDDQVAFAINAAAIGRDSIEKIRMTRPSSCLRVINSAAIGRETIANGELVERCRDPGVDLENARRAPAVDRY